MFRIFLIFLLSIFLAACGLNPAPNPTTGYYPTSSKLNYGELVIAQPIDSQKYNRLLVFGVSTYLNPQYPSLENNYWRKALLNLGIFNNVVGIDKLPDFLRSQGYINGVPDIVSDEASLRQVSKIYGNFLFVKIDRTCSALNCNMAFTVIDPATGKTYFLVNRNSRALFQGDLDYPVYNTFKAWFTQTK